MPNSKKPESVCPTKNPGDLISTKSMTVIETGTPPSLATTSLKELSFKQWTTVGMLAFANLFSTITYNCILPFFPAEAKKKGLDTTEIGFIFGIFELVTLITSPLYGRYLHTFGARKLFYFGLFSTGISNIAFGFLNLVPDGRVFFWTSFGGRCLISLGDTAFLISTFAIGSKCFPGRISMIVGIMETFAGLGFAVGPLIGGLLYEHGGFLLPFFTLGSSLILMTFLSFFLIEEFNEDNKESDSGKGIFRMLKIPAIWIMIFAVILYTTSLCFFSPTLADHLSDFNPSATFVGLIFLISQATYAASAPIFGFLIDRWRCGSTIMIFGSTTVAASMLLVGPSPLLNFGKNLILIEFSLAVLGIAFGALYIPTYKNCLDAAKEHGYEDGSKTYGYISGIIQSAFAFGAFIGPTLGSFGVEKVGFGWTTTVIASINVVFVLILIIFLATKSKVHPKPSITSELGKNNYPV